jgi:hypothetical protein
MEKEKLEKIVKESKTKKECLDKLGLRAAGGNYKTLIKYIKKYNIDDSHFDPKMIKVNNLNNYIKLFVKVPLEKVLTVNSAYSRTSLKKRLYDEGIKKKKCELCGQGEEWNGNQMSLILDHINGVWNDNRLENLRIVCPNCNSTLPTHCGKKNSTKYKEEYDKLIINERKKEFHISRRKVVRPDYNTLINEVENFGYVKTGKKYGVSDNSIRKWIRFYEKYN